jgi:hypothetical protein
MSEDKVDITPTDGVSNYWIEFAGFDKPYRSTGANIRFDIIEQDGKKDHYRATLSFPVAAADDGLHGMIARAHDDLIDALRQMLFSSDKMRSYYRELASAKSPK